MDEDKPARTRSDPERTRLDAAAGAILSERARAN